MKSKREGVLLLNLGSPEAPSRSAVRRYLREFLMDRYVIDLPWVWRAALVHGWIAPLRSKPSAHAYSQIWGEDGSPLVTLSRKFREKVEMEAPSLAIEHGMRYGEPNLEGALSRLRATGVENLKVVPMYPQFAKASTITGIAAVAAAQQRLGWSVPVTFLQDFFAEPEWIESLAARVREADRGFRADFLLMSYHGLPEHHVREFDESQTHCLAAANCCETGAPTKCYRAQCFATSRELVKALNWDPAKAKVSFQSRLGRRPWIRPFSDEVIVTAAKSGVRRILVACPSFVADCLETLEEVAIRLRRDFIAAGGEDLRLVPAVNDSEIWVKGFIRMIGRSSLNWLDEASALRLLP